MKMFARVFIALGLLGIAHGLWAVGAANPPKVTYYPAYPPVNYNSGAGTKAQIQEGEYLTKAGDCISCHTDSSKPNSPPYGGGTYTFTPFGLVYGPNISADPQYGIGNWTDDQFVDAVRKGIGPEGYVFPVMPYVHYNQFSRAETLAIKAYLMSVPAVHQPSTPSKMMFPFGWRFLQLGWRIMFFQFNQLGVYQADPSQSAQWNRGKFLVDGPAHCGMCHTPLNLLGGEKNQYYLTGGNLIDGFYTPDITSGALKNASVQQIVDVFKKNQMLNGGKVGGPMLEANTNSFQKMTDADLIAIAVYIKSVPSHYPPASGDTTVTPETGVKIYTKVCASCHDSGGAGAPRITDKAAWQVILAQTGGINTVYNNAINGIGSMPAKGTCMTCTDAQIKAVVDYIVDTAQHAGANSGPKPTTAAPIKLSLLEGQQVYQRSCASCHDKGMDGAPKLGDKQTWQPLIDKNMDVLFTHTLKGYGNMPAKGGCTQCTTIEIEAAVRYMVNQSKENGDYSLW